MSQVVRPVGDSAAVAGARPRRRIGRSLHRDVAYPIVTALLFLVVWQVLIGALEVPRYILPAPSAILTTLVDKFGLLWQHSLITAGEVLLGFALSIAIGLPLAVLTVASPLFSRTVYPLIVASQSVPKMAIAPLFIVWFGFGTTPKVLVAFLIAFFPIVIDSAVGLRSVPREMIWLARSIGLGPLETFFKIRLPRALPSIFGGLKIAITLAVIGAVVGEFLGSDSGLGHLLVIANGTLDTPMLFASLFMLTALGLIFYGLLSLVELLVIPWSSHGEEHGATGSL